MRRIETNFQDLNEYIKHDDLQIPWAGICEAFRYTGTFREHRELLKKHMELTSGLSPDTSIQPTFTDVGQEVDDTHQVPSDTSGQVTVHENEFRSRQPDSFNSMGVNEVADMYDPERYDSDDKLHSTRSSSIDQDSQDVGPSAGEGVQNTNYDLDYLHAF